MGSIVVILSYGYKRVEVTIQNALNSSLNQIASTFNQQAITSNQLNNAQNLCKLRVKISQYGISLLPANMSDFRVCYKFHF